MPPTLSTEPTTTSTALATTSTAITTTSPGGAEGSIPHVESSPVTLRGDGLGTLAFGVEAAPVLALVTSVLGVAGSDESTEFEPNDTTGLFTNELNVFAYGRGRTVCWPDVLCLYFGGSSFDALQFVGWWYHPESGDDSLSTDDGIAIGSVLSDHLESITVRQDTACLSEIAGKTAGGILVGMHSIGEPFLTYDDSSGEFIKGNPSPEDIVVIGLSSGDSVVAMDGDC